MPHRPRSKSFLATALLLGSLVALPGNHGAFARQTSAHDASAAHVQLVHPGFLSVGSDTTYPPMESSDVRHPGRFIGADVDLAGALARAMGLKGARIVTTNFNSIIAALQRRNFDVIMSSMNDTPERRKQLAFIDYMRLNAAEAILVSKSSPIHARGYKGLCGRSVSVESGTVEFDGVTAANKTCAKKITIRAFTADTDAFQALAAGHVDAYTTDLPVALFYLKRTGGADRLAGPAFGTGGYYGIGMLKSAGGLRSSLTRAFQKIRANGQYKQILKRYGLSSTAL